MDVMLVTPGEPAHRIIGVDGDGIARGCPAFAPGTARLAVGEAAGDNEAGWTDAALVIADVSAAGEASMLMRMELDGATSMPCAVWSADGRRVAFYANTDPSGGNSTRDAADVWILDTETGDSRRLADLVATDIEWAPDGSRLYIAGKDGISVYSIAEDAARTLGGTARTRMLAVSPNGQTLAMERRRSNASDAYELVLIDADGSDERVVVGHYRQMYGIGPVWSPDGRSVAFQRSCRTYTDASGAVQTCYPQHEVVVVSAGDDDPGIPAGTETVIPTVRSGEGADSRLWFPTTVAWSPDSTTLLYLAWGQPYGWPDERTDGAFGVIAVPVTDASTSTVLYETTEGRDGYDVLATNSQQSWVAP